MMSFDTLYKIDEIAAWLEMGVDAVITLLAVFIAYRYREFWLFKLLIGAYGCLLMGDLFAALHYTITGVWPFIFSAADISYLGFYCFLIAIDLELLGALKEQERQVAQQYRYTALIAAVVVILCNIWYITIYPDIIICYIIYCIPFSFLGYYTLLLFLTSRKTRGEAPSMYAYHTMVSLYIVMELVMWYISSITVSEIHLLLSIVATLMLYLPTVLLLPTAKKGLGL